MPNSLAYNSLWQVRTDGCPGTPPPSQAGPTLQEEDEPKVTRRPQPKPPA